MTDTARTDQQADDCTCIEPPEIDDSGEVLHARYCLAYTPFDEERASDCACGGQTLLMIHRCANEGGCKDPEGREMEWVKALPEGTNREQILAAMAKADAELAELVKLAERWRRMADAGPDLATLTQAQVPQYNRATTYGKAAADLNHVLQTGRIPHDLLTDAEEQRHAGEAPTA